jgi:hypothetical protein
LAALLEHDPEKWEPVFPRDKREAFARRSCSNKKMDDGHDSTLLNHALTAANPEIWAPIGQILEPKATQKAAWRGH